MIAVCTILYIGLIMVFYKVMRIKPNPTNIAAMVVLGVVLIGAIVIMWKFSAPMSNQLVVSRYAVQIVPQVKGPIEKIHAEPNVLLKKDEDLLFEIQPDLYQMALDQATATLEATKKNAVEVEKSVSVAEAAVKQAEASLSAANAELDVAKEVEKINPDAIAKLEVVKLTEKYNAAKATVAQANANREQTSAALEAANAKVPAAEAQVETAQFNLDQCKVYAPSDGFVTNWQVREGSMAVSFPFAPMGTFVDTTKTNLVAAFPQNVLVNVKADDPIEVAVKTRPGEIFKGKVLDVVQATGEGQFATSGQLVSAAEIKSEGMLAVRFELEDLEVAEQLAMGAAGNVTVYTDSGKPFQIISKVAIRMNAWTYYFIPF